MARLRRIAQWTGLAATALIAGMFAASLAWQVSWLFWCPPDGRVRAVQLESGSIEYFSWFNVDGDPARGFHASRTRSGADVRWRPSWNVGDSIAIAVVPLWLPLVVAAAPSAIFVYLDRPTARRRRAGQCAHCGYSLAGLPGGGPCPECGSERA